MRRTGVVIGAGVVALCAGAGAAQPLGGWILDIDYGPGRHAVSPLNPSATVTCVAWFPTSPNYAFAAARWDVLTEDGIWSDNRVLPPLHVFSNPGVIDGSAVRGIIAGQIHFPPTLPANPANPIAAWSAVWTATDFRAREVDVWTQTARMDVYLMNHPHTWGVWPLGEGAGVIAVVPPPSALAALVVGVAAAACTRKRGGQ